MHKIIAVNVVKATAAAQLPPLVSPSTKKVVFVVNGPFSSTGPPRGRHSKLTNQGKKVLSENLCTEHNRHQILLALGSSGYSPGSKVRMHLVVYFARGAVTMLELQCVHAQITTG